MNQFDPDSLPVPEPLKALFEPDFYGASTLIARTVGLPATPRSFSSWMHGCDFLPVPRKVLTPQSPDPAQTHLVQNKAVENWWKANGFPLAVATGCPFIYTEPSGVERIPGSVLAIPYHTTPGTRLDDGHMIRWLIQVAGLTQRFSIVAVCIYADDVERIAPLAEKLGLVWFTGANLNSYALPRVRAMFESFEYVITDFLGSSMAYGAWCGCRVSMFGELVDPQEDDFRGSIFYQRHPEALENIAWYKPDRVRERFPFLFPEALEDAVFPKGWSDDLLGENCKRSAREIGRLLGWRYDARDSAFAGMAYAEAAAWLGAANPSEEEAYLKRQIERQKGRRKAVSAELLEVQSELENSLKKQEEFARSWAGRLGFKLFSMKKRLDGSDRQDDV